MMTMTDIEALEKQLREARELQDLQRLGHALMLHAPELLARARAWERVREAGLVDDEGDADAPRGKRA